VAVDLRDTRRQGLGLTGYAWFLEGLASYRSHLPEPAWVAFRKIPLWPVEDALLGYRMAKDLTDFGDPELAKDVLVSLERAAGGTAEYWFHLVVAAYEAHEFDTMLDAAEKAYHLAPNNLVYINNYAAALLMQRKNPALAVELTLRKLSATPQDDGARLNHVLALLQNERVAEAATLLRAVDDRRLESRLHTIFNLALFELEFREHHRPEALAAYGQIENRFLLAPQLTWLKETHGRLVEEKP
jgi:tetratricopeptide (TPR) repeat protein